MYERLRFIVAFCVYYSGLVKLIYWWTRRKPGRRLIILKYHRASEKNLRKQLLYLSRHHRVMHLEDALQELYAPSLKEGQKDGSSVPVVVTFDDGYRDNYSHAFAIARELGIPFTIFLPPGYIESGSCFWWLESQRLVNYARANKVIVDGHVYYLEQQSDRKELCQKIDAHVRYATSIVQREAFLTDMREALDVPTDAPVVEDALPLRWQEIQQMDKSGLVSFGGHTMNHPILAYLSDPQEVYKEVEECRRVLELQLGHPVRTFAYPIGSINHIGEEALQAVKDAGYAWAVTTTSAVNTPEADPYLLNRLSANDDTHWLDLALIIASELAGLRPIISRLRRRLRWATL
jgi:peptidoglycan/xylan/chitin deacetylase (PgdA/CDA1 family)